MPDAIITILATAYSSFAGVLNFQSTSSLHLLLSELEYTKLVKISIARILSGFYKVQFHMVSHCSDQAQSGAVGPY